MESADPPPHVGGYVTAVRGAVFVLMSLLPVLALTGCKGISQPGEREARKQVQDVGAGFRPDGNRPQLPELSTNSSVGDFLHYAMLNHPAVEAAYFDWAASVERITVERSLPDPKLTFEADIADVVMTVMPGLMQEFPGPGKLKAAARVASAESEMGYFVFESAVLRTAFDVKRACFSLAALDERLRIDRETLTLLKDLERISRAQNEVGKGTLQDVYRAQIEEDQLTTELTNLEDSRLSLLAQLKAALGITPNQPDPPVPVRTDPSPLELNTDTLLATAFERNPRLKSMEADVRAAEARIVQAQKSKVPDFSLGVMTDVKASPVMVRPLAEVTLPIWRDKIAAEIAQARASSRAAQARLSNEQIMLAADFAMKTYSYRELTRRLVLLRQQLIPKARQSLQIARSGYLSGQIDFFNLIDSQQKLLAFQLAEVDARTEREMVLAELSLMIAGVPPEGAPLRTTEKSKH